MAADDENDKARVPQADSHDHTPAGSSKTFLKPFVKSVANAGRSVGAGIYHAGKVVDAITDLTERISLPRAAGSPNLSSTSHAEFGLPMESSDNVPEERREKSRPFKGKFKNAGSYGPGTSSDTGSDSYLSQAALSRLNSLQLSRDDFPHLDSHMSRNRYSRAHTDHIGFLKCDDDEAEGHLMINSEDDPDGPADRRDAVYNYEAVFPRSRLQSMCKLPFAKRRHTIHIPQDYKLVPVRHSIKKQNMEVQLIWKYRLLKKMDQKQRSVLEALEILEGLYHSTAKEAEIKSREVKDRLEGYVEQNKLAAELLSFLPNDPLLLNQSTTPSSSSSDLQPHPSGDIFPSSPFHHHHHQPRQLSVSSKALSWDKVDPQTWELYKELTSAGEILRQRRHEVSNKRRMMDNHVDELIKQAGLKRPARRRDHPSGRPPPKGSALEKTSPHTAQRDAMLEKETRKLKVAISHGGAEGGDHDGDDHGEEEEGEGRVRGSLESDSKLVIAMAEGVITTIEQDPSLQVAEFVELVVVAGLARLLGTITAWLASAFRAAVRFLLVFFVHQIHRLAARLELDEGEHHELGTTPHFFPRRPRTRHSPPPDLHDTQDGHRVQE
ncbi:hypothetical protein PCANC_00734 [Puccinia coronata f. sp. avenae]|uniref:Uncharacterized protein n=1 Tax=Puccinia coronata f. sp. avenae TaxID=200324 RepID=A0A2N5W737_9BASI|nr:hypothetical protein PCANC_00734 [Puccinia coronata f. sp. avenae]